MKDVLDAIDKVAEKYCYEHKLLKQDAGVSIDFHPIGENAGIYIISINDSEVGNVTYINNSIIMTNYGVKDDEVPDRKN